MTMHLAILYCPRSKGNLFPYLGRLLVLVRLFSGESVLPKPLHEGDVGASAGELVLRRMHVSVDESCGERKAGGRAVLD